MNIIYTSNAGHTMEYAKLLKHELNCECYTIKEAKKHLKKNDEVIYLTWIMAGNPKGIKKVLKRYKVVLCATVGMTFNKIDQNDIINKYNLTCPLFYLPGGFDIARLSGVYKIIMESMMDKLKIKSSEELSDDEKLCYEGVVNGCNYVSRERLSNIINYIKEEKK